MDNMAHILQVQNDSHIVSLKQDVLRCLGLISYAVNFYSQIGKAECASQVQAMLSSQNLIQALFDNLTNASEEIRCLTYLLIGHYMKAGISIGQLLYDS